MEELILRKAAGVAQSVRAFLPQSGGRVLESNKLCVYSPVFMMFLSTSKLEIDDPKTRNIAWP